MLGTSFIINHMMSDAHKVRVKQFISAPNPDESAPTPKDIAIRISGVVDEYSIKVKEYSSNSLVLAPFVVCVARCEWL